MLFLVVDHLLFILRLYIGLATGFLLLLLLLMIGCRCICVDQEVLLMAWYTVSTA